MTGTWATGFATGDIITAAEYKKQAGSIFDTTLGVAAPNVDITGISATYAHLLITAYTRGDTAALNTPLDMRFNSDSSANYDYQFESASAATATAGESFGVTFIQVGTTPAATAGANLFNEAQIFIPHYAGTTNNKQVVSLASHKQATTTGSLSVQMFGGSWRSNAAINEVMLFPSVGNFAAGTRVTVHALGA